jgi:cytochrome c biogenesis protein CcmG/thiol:disulfide interchange protein DsbE
VVTFSQSARGLSYQTGKWIVVLLFNAALLTLAGCHKPAADSNLSPPVVSAPPPSTYPMPPTKSTTHGNLGWTTASEQHMRLSDYQNKVVILDFYATWCEPCRDSIPHLVELQKRYGSRGLQVVGLNVGGPGDPEQVPAFAREFHIQYQLGVPDADLANLYTGDENVIPQTVVLDRQGQLVKRIVGYDESVGEQLEEIIQAPLAAAGGN